VGTAKITGMTQTSGATDFDFVFGRWVVHNRKLRDNRDPTCDDWVEFDATSEVWPLLRTGFHVDRMEATDPPDGDPFEGATFRLYDPEAKTWRIWWSSTRAPGQLDEPVVGSFDGDIGTFECDDVIGGRQVRVRFTWHRGDSEAPRWEQAFSFDGGDTYRVNWVMEFSPAA
jgi:hypothetical protein